jgi:hypothetical protein
MGENGSAGWRIGRRDEGIDPVTLHSIYLAAKSLRVHPDKGGAFMPN